MIAALRLYIRLRLRRGWRSLAPLALLFGLSGAITVSAFVGMARTSTAFDRLAAASRGADVLVNPDRGDGSALRPEQLAAVPHVKHASYVQGLLVIPTVLTRPDDIGIAVASPDADYGVVFDQPKITEGRLPSPDRADEVFLNQNYAKVLGVHAGDTLAAVAVSDTDFAGIPGPVDNNPLPYIHSGKVGRPLSLQVVGVGISTNDIVVDQGFEESVMTLTPAYLRSHRNDSAGYWGGLVTLEHGDRDLTAFRQSLTALVAKDDGINFKSTALTRDKVRRAVRPTVSALLVFTLIVGAGGVVLVVQALSRRLAIAARDDGTLRALGFTRRDLFWAASGDVLAVCAVGLLLALCGAIALSGIFPIGPARLAEPHPGVHLDAARLLIGATVFAGSVAALSLALAWRHCRPDARDVAARPLVFATLAARLSRWPSVSSGVRSALARGPGANAIPVWTTLSAAMGSVAVIVASVVFGASLGHLGRTPRLFGWNWDQTMSFEDNGNLAPDQLREFASVTEAALTRVLNGSNDVGGWSLYDLTSLTINGQPVVGIGVDPRRGAAHPTIVTGRVPTSADEIALGGLTMRRLHVGIGDEVTATLGSNSQRLRIVGRVVTPALGAYSGSDKPAIGEGAMVLRSALTTIGPALGNSGVQAFIRYAPAPGARERVAKGLFDALPAAASSSGHSWSADRFDLNFGDVARPTDVRNYERVQRLPALLAAVLAAMAGTAVVHALVTAVRVRRRDLAVLRATGFTRAQVLISVCTQSVAIAVVAVVIGLPLGIVSGRVAWGALAHSIGAVSETIVPPTLALLPPAVLLFALVVAVIPGLRAIRVLPANALRSE